MKYRCILLDADNTLLDFDRSEAEALRLALNSFQIPFSHALIPVYHRINRACWAAYERGELTKERLRVRRFEEFLTEAGADHSASEFADVYLQALADTDYLIEGATALLDRLAANYRLVLVTNGLKEVQHPRLDKTGLRPFFEAIVISDEIGHSKPNSSFFDYTFTCLGQPPRGEVLIVGDNFNADIRGGHEYGMATCWFNPAKNTGPDDLIPTYEIARLKELEHLLEGGSV
jgi:YjjG family noncanonical pyrimidine nucleotidase